MLDLASGLERASLQGESDSVVTELAISRDGQALASVAAGVVTVWDLAAGWQREVSATDRQEIGVTDLVFSPDGQILAGVEAGNRIVVWDVATGAEQWIFPHGDGVVKDVAFCPDGRLLASIEEAAQITLWDLATGEEGLTLNNPSAAPVTGIASTPSVRAWQPSMQTARSRCGTPSRVMCNRRLNIEAKSIPWLSARTGLYWPVEALIPKSPCGTC